MIYLIAEAVDKLAKKTDCRLADLDTFSQALDFTQDPNIDLGIKKYILIKLFIIYNK